MGLDTTHDCWHGSYSAFNRWRTKICEVAGYGNLEDYKGFGGQKQWPANDPLVELLHHSDCDGEIPTASCALIAGRLCELMPALKRAGEGGGHIGDYATKTQSFIDGLLAASEAGEDVVFQ